MLGNFSYSNPTKLYFGENAGVMSNPTAEKLMEGAKLARENAGSCWKSVPL